MILTIGNQKHFWSKVSTLLSLIFKPLWFCYSCLNWNPQLLESLNLFSHNVDIKQMQSYLVFNSINYQTVLLIIFLVLHVVKSKEWIACEHRICVCALTNYYHFGVAACSAPDITSDPRLEPYHVSVAVAVPKESLFEPTRNQWFIIRPKLRRLNQRLVTYIHIIIR